MVPNFELHRQLNYFLMMPPYLTYHTVLCIFSLEAKLRARCHGKNHDI